MSTPKIERTNIDTRSHEISMGKTDLSIALILSILLVFVHTNMIECSFQMTENMLNYSYHRQKNFHFTELFSNLFKNTDISLRKNTIHVPR